MYRERIHFDFPRTLFARRIEFVEKFPLFDEFGVQRGKTAHFFGDARPRVEKNAVAGNFHKRLMIVLTVDVDEKCRKRGQVGSRNGRTLNPRGRLSRVAERAAHKHATVIAFDTVFQKPRFGSNSFFFTVGSCVRFRHIVFGAAVSVCSAEQKGSRHRRFVSTASDHLSVRLSAEQKRQGADEDRFACARFSRKHGKAARKFYRNRIDESEIFNRQVFEHEALPTNSILNEARCKIFPSCSPQALLCARLSVR